MWWEEEWVCIGNECRYENYRFMIKCSRCGKERNNSSQTIGSDNKHVSNSSQGGIEEDGVRVEYNLKANDNQEN